jgi:hypothetical protein
LQIPIKIEVTVATHAGEHTVLASDMALNIVDPCRNKGLVGFTVAAVLSSKKEQKAIRVRQARASV